MRTSALLLFVWLPCWAMAIDPVFTEYQDRVDRGVERGLAYLSENFDEQKGFPGKNGQTTGVVALGGMAFLSKGHLPGEGSFGAVINGCIDYVLARQQEDGVLARARSGNSLMYSHSISTLFLSEVSGMVDPVRQQKIDEALAMALRLLLDAQAVPKSAKNRGGWRYKPESTDSDLSCSGWALMALRSARLNGAPVPDEAISAAVDYVFACFDEKTGGFGYTGPSARETLAGCGLLCLELVGRHGDPRLAKTGDYILSTAEKLVAKDHELYANYYNAQAMFQLGGNYWKKYAAWMYENYLPQQTPNGSWMSRKYGQGYGTSMVILALAVPYRQLPIYQRDETVDRIGGRREGE